MAGLFDMLNGSPQAQGLLAATAQILQASGPSLRPQGLGQILGGGLAAYQDTEQQARHSGQLEQLRGLQIKGMESDLQAQELARQRAQEYQALVKSYQATRGVQQQPMPQIDRSANAMFQAGPGAGAPAMLAPGEQQQPEPSPAPAGARNALVQEGLQFARYLNDKGFRSEAQAAAAEALKMQPKVSRWEEVQQNGRVMFAPFFEDGTNGAPVPLDVAKKLDAINRGGETDLVHPVTGETVRSLRNSVSPDAALSAATQRRGQDLVDKRAAVSAAAASSAEGLLPDNVVELMAQQYLVGDTSVMQNLGRGAQGAQNIIRLRTEIARQAAAAGKGGADLAAQNAEYFGTKAGQRSAGTRIANVEMAVYEAQNLVPLALDASRNVARSGLLPFGKGQVMFNEQTNNPAMREFAAANNALVNTYARAISPTGQPTISDKDHARELLSTAYDQPSYEATVNQMNREMEAARKAPQQVRQAFNQAVTGRGGHDEQKPPAPAVRQSAPLKSAIKGQVMDGYRFKGGNPADPNALEKL